MSEKSPTELEQECKKMLEKEFEPEYFTIADERSMKPITKWSDSRQARAFVAAYCGSVRLIDNLSLHTISQDR